MLDHKTIPAFRDALFAGKYNLLLGSGISGNSRDRHGTLLRGTEQLRQDICAATGAKPSTTLPRAASLLTRTQRDAQLVDRYSHCQPGNELLPLRRCLWKRLFTFNIDDLFESLYGRSNGAQELVTLNFDSAFEPDTDPSEVQCVHLHGWARLPDSGFVFSHNEYARVVQGNNPWMLLLCETLPVESFIIAGTSLDEPDLEHYLARRTASTPRRGRGPSLLIEPNADAATFADCKRYDLTLVEAEFGQFLAWIEATFPERPTARKLIVPNVADLFRTELPPLALLRFFSDFELVAATSLPTATGPPAYMYGAEPTWSDIDQHLDVERGANQPVMDWVRQRLDGAGTQERVLLISDDPATGKSTLLKRVGSDLASLGSVVLHVKTLARLDAANSARCLTCIIPEAVESVTGGV